jgi:hypothetical protein
MLEGAREREVGEVVSALGLALLMGRHAVAHICELERSPVRTCSVPHSTVLSNRGVRTGSAGTAMICKRCDAGRASVYGLLLFCGSMDVRS